MIDLEQLQILAQAVNSLNIFAAKLEKAYNERDLENFNDCKRNILDIQKKISQIAK